MNGFSFLMLVFSICILITGIYIYTGHRNDIILWRVANVKTMPKKELQKIGKWTMISSIIPFILSIIGLFLNI